MYLLVVTRGLLLSLVLSAEVSIDTLANEDRLDGSIAKNDARCKETVYNCN
jgi:hypothetical protein